MDQSQPPVVSKWLWITLIIIILIGGGFLSWYYLMGPGKKVAATTTTTPTTSTSTTTSSNVFDLATAKAGDKVGSMTIVSIAPFSATDTNNNTLSSKNAKILFSGQTEVAGEYDYAFSGIGGNYELTFTIDTASLKILPQIKGQGDVLPRVGFTNNDQALSLLSITKGTAKKGTVKLTVDKFIIQRYPTEIRDMFSIVKVN